MMTNDTLAYVPCPRCLGVIENAGMSRATPDRDIEICGPCSSDEALREIAEEWVVPVADWPMVDDGEIRFGPLDAHYFRHELLAIVDAAVGQL